MRVRFVRGDFKKNARAGASSQDNLVGWEGVGFRNLFPFLRSTGDFYLYQPLGGTTVGRHMDEQLLHLEQLARTQQPAAQP